jgi:hypothetical protein
VIDLHSLVDLVRFRPDEENANRVPGSRTLHQVFIDVELPGSRGAVVMGLVEPGEELDGLGDFLFRRPDGPIGGLAGPS